MYVFYSGVLAIIVFNIKTTFMFKWLVYYFK
jgi:hypothetical protein